MFSKFVHKKLYPRKKHDIIVHLKTTRYNIIYLLQEILEKSTFATRKESVVGRPPRALDRKGAKFRTVPY